ncbi:MAG: amidohydrolase family protein [Chloroflexi bacterium]|nr:amidohydrolase family protein [Chloroflexota bacterium]MCH8351372.1 amidohydrolase family protein [Chloroflexota bacterium]MCI0780701.1 amidohydrolase family protein [Chloroflexota bacterium]MCI0785221.1 amidohydrolase family protein [Chloroflexota bacterium]MCI0794029.1 amidohydrolase family protein [Chloroflexota bacterium]
MAKNGFRVLDSDLHLMEPADLYRRYLAPEFMGRAPLATHDQPGHYAGWVLEGQPIPPWIGDDQVLRANAEMDLKSRQVMKDGWDRHFDPGSSLRAMDAEGVDVAVLFRTAASMLVSLDSLDPPYALALCRAFNDWVADYCKEDPTRLKATTIVPQHDGQLAAEEARRSVQELGSLGIVLLPMPVAGNHVHDPEFDPLWAELERLQVPACFHGTSGAVSQEYLGTRLAGHPGYRTLSHASVFPLEQMMAMGSMILGGVLERFPNLKVAFLEGNCSWLPWWLYRLDDQWAKFGAGESVQLSEKPSTYFMRQCFISIDPDELPAVDMIKRLGDDNVVFSTDYPHPDSAFPHAVEEFLAIDGISAASQKKILWDNCARLYGL